MKYGERLHAARMHANLTQAGLAHKIGNICSQENISKLERGDATGSEYTVQFANACGVRPEWLAMESGLMTNDEAPLIVTDSGLINAVHALEKMPPELRAEQIRGIYSIVKHLTHPEKNGTQ